MAEPSGRDPFNDAADSYANAGRDLRGRTPPRGLAGADLRLAGVSLLMLSRLGTNDNSTFLALAAALGGLVQAVADRRAPKAAPRKRWLPSAAAACSARSAPRRRRPSDSPLGVNRRPSKAV